MMAYSSSSDESEKSLILSVSDSSYEIEEPHSDTSGTVEREYGHLPYRFEPYASESDDKNTDSDSDHSGVGEAQQPIPVNFQRLSNTEWLVYV